eukprot:GILK01008432.1.p1 GENE.GILK01008432.1~~GILK01008432.1.p1  ORF type:complete len:404 (+),score=51.24 GILK01008432.1:45-1256(+)
MATKCDKSCQCSNCRYISVALQAINIASSYSVTKNEIAKEANEFRGLLESLSAKHQSIIDSTFPTDGDADPMKIFIDKRPYYQWLDFNPNAFLPENFQRFLLTGICAPVPLPESNNIKPVDTAPIFVVGCGRSGTTILGRMLSCHPHIAYLNEPRQLWMTYMNLFDIWSAMSRSRQGQLVMQDTESVQVAALNQHFLSIPSMVDRQVLCEKTPENVFKLPFIKTVFPSAKFVHILRNGRSVARSIARFQLHTWFGSDGYKWEQLLQALRMPQFNFSVPVSFLSLCEYSLFARGLLEWALGVVAGRYFARQLGQTQDMHECYLEIRYEDLLTSCESVLTRIEVFGGLEHSDEMIQLAKSILENPEEKRTKAGTAVSVLSKDEEDSIIELSGQDICNLLRELGGI